MRYKIAEMGDFMMLIQYLKPGVSSINYSQYNGIKED